MKEKLLKKLATSLPYTREELEWLLAHIGDPNPEIRDKLVYASFCHALLDNLITTSDFRWLANEMIQRKLLFYKITETDQATLTRSFTSLLAALLMGVDGDEQSNYKDALFGEQRDILFQQALQYLTEEIDITGWSTEFGWVHAFAHGAEFLLYASLHPRFPATNIATVWKTIVTLLKRQTTVFTAGEERRLALIISQLVLQQKLSQTELASWIEQTTFPDKTAPEYFAQVNFENFLLAISNYLEKEETITPLLKHTILEKWNGY